MIVWSSFQQICPFRELDVPWSLVLDWASYLLQVLYSAREALRPLTDSIREVETFHWYCYRTSYFLKEVFRISFVLISIHFKTKHFRGSFEFHRIHSSTASDVKERRLSIDAYPICWCYWSCWYLLIQSSSLTRRNPLVVSAAAAHPPVFLLVLIRLVRPQGSATDWALCHAEADPLIQTNGRFLLLLASQQSVSSYQFQSCIIACLDSTGG